MQIFREIAGYTFGHADVVRRAISKKKQGVLDGERQAFIDGAVSQGIDENEAVKLFEDIVSFANYAFNKSHAAAYGVLSFRTAYLKTHYQREYAAALLTSVLSSTEKLAEYIADCTKQGIRILPPDINKSRSSFHVEGDSIRFGLTAVKSIGGHFIDQLIAERERGGDFKDMDDFMFRTSSVDMNKRQLEVLIKAGAFDSLGTPRSQLLAVYERMLEKRSASGRDTFDCQIGLFDLGGNVEAPKPLKIEYPQIPEFSSREKLALEKESCGLYLSGHVLDDYSRHLEKIKPVKIADIHASFRQEEEFGSDENLQESADNALSLTDKSRLVIAGSITKRVNKATKSGEQMAFITVEDRTSSMEMLVFPKILSKYGHTLVYDAAVAVRGTLSVREDEDVKILADTIVNLVPDGMFESSVIVPELENVSERNLNTRQEKPKEVPPSPVQKYTVPRKLYLRVPDENSREYRRAAAICGIFTGGIPATFYSEAKKEYLQPPMSVNPTPFVIAELRELLGEDNVVVK